MELLKWGELAVGVLTALAGWRWWSVRASRQKAEAEASESQAEAAALRFRTVDDIATHFTLRLGEMAARISDLAEADMEQQEEISELRRQVRTLEESLQIERAKTERLTKELEHERKIVAALEAYLVALQEEGQWVESPRVAKLRAAVESLRAG